MDTSNFFTEVVLIALSASALLYTVIRKFDHTIEKAEDAPNQEWYVIQSHIWATDVKQAVEDFVSFVKRETAKSGSGDKYVELFSDQNKIHSLKSRLISLIKCYNDYLNFNNLLSDMISATEQLNKWLGRTIVLLLALAGWGATGFVLETQESISVFPQNTFWFAFCILIGVLSWFIYKIARISEKCRILKARIRPERTKYAHLVEKVV